MTETELLNLVVDKSLGEWDKDNTYSEIDDMLYQVYIHWYLKYSYKLMKNNEFQ